MSKTKFEEIINIENVKNAAKTFGKEAPFDHAVIDNFFKEDFAKKLESEFPDFNDPLWHQYSNPIEIKKVCNDWNIFPANTYKAFATLNSPEFVDFLAGEVFGNKKLHSDPGLNGGGWHMHGKGGKLNTHLDYSIHPKLGLERKLNIIIYLNSSWKPEWGGHLGLWGNESAEKPGKLIKSVEPKYNRAAIFDTTQNSWHGLPNPLTCPDNQQRKSLAVYYLCEPAKGASERGKALFAPTEEQSLDQEVLDLIKKRSNVATAAEVYKK